VKSERPYTTRQPYSTRHDTVQYSTRHVQYPTVQYITLHSTVLYTPTRHEKRNRTSDALPTNLQLHDTIDADGRTSCVFVAL